MKRISQKSSRIILRVSQKSSTVAKKISQKSPGVLSNLSNVLNGASSLTAAFATGATLIGQPEIGLPLAAISGGLGLGGGITKGLSKSAQKSKEGKYGGALNTLEKTTVDAVKKSSKMGII